MLENPCRCSYQAGYMVVRKDDDVKKVHLSEIGSVVLHTQQAYISAYLLAELSKAKIPFIYTDEKHNPVGECLPIYGAHNTSKRINEQLGWGEPIKKRVWQRVIKEKITQQAAVLDWAGMPNSQKRLIQMVSEVRSGDTTNKEAQAARLYFSELFGAEFNRDLDIPINAALNYGYAILLSLVNSEIVSRGYLTQRGINHRNEFNEFNLGCDFMEPFRPCVDRLVSMSIGDDFTQEDKRYLCDLPNQYVTYRGGQYRLGSVVSLFIQDCFNALNKKISVEEIEGFSL